MSCWSTSFSAAARRCSGPISSGWLFRNSVRRSSSSTSLSVMTAAPTTTATRSTTPAAAVRTSREIASPIRISKRLPDRKEELKVTHALNRRCGRVQQKLLGALQAVERRRVDAVCQVHAHRPHRRLVANAETSGVYHVVEIFEILLVRPE